MIVIDASVLATSLTDDGPAGRQARASLADDSHWAAPEHLVVEVFSAIRGRWLGGKISDRRAVDAVEAVAEATLDLAHTTALLPRMWQLRANLSGYDAAYVALAEAHGCPLVTADRRLAAASGVRCEVRFVVDES